jgi:hypothetical protein
MDPWLQPRRRGEDRILGSNGWSCSIIVTVLIAISDETNWSPTTTFPAYSESFSDFFASGGRNLFNNTRFPSVFTLQHFAVLAIDLASGKTRIM